MKFWPLGCREAFFKDFLLRLDKICEVCEKRSVAAESRGKDFVRQPENVLRDMTQLEEMELLDSDSEANGNVGD